MLKFTGKFRDLKPAGYTFQKLYARNYRSYRKEVSPAETIWIWQHNGGYVEFNDLYDLSRLAARAVYLDQQPGDGGAFAYDMDTNTLEPYSNEHHNPMFVILLREKELGRKLDDLEFVETCARCERWKRVFVSNRLREAILDMHSRGWINLDTIL